MGVHSLHGTVYNMKLLAPALLLFGIVQAGDPPAKYLNKNSLCRDSKGKVRNFAKNGKSNEWCKYRNINTWYCKLVRKTGYNPKSCQEYRPASDKKWDWDECCREPPHGKCFCQCVSQQDARNYDAEKNKNNNKSAELDWAMTCKAELS